jgi:hypothetical protein
MKNTPFSLKGPYRVVKFGKLFRIIKENGVLLPIPPIPRQSQVLIVCKLVDECFLDGQKSREGLRKALVSISRNTCCEPCQEAKLVALHALKDDGQGAA